MDAREKEIANKKKWSLEDDEDDEDMEEGDKTVHETEQTDVNMEEGRENVEMDGAEADPLEEFMAQEILPKMEEDVKQALFLEEKEEQNAIKDGRIEDARSVHVPDAKTDKKKEIDPYDSDASDFWHIEDDDDDEDDEVTAEWQRISAEANASVL